MKILKDSYNEAISLLSDNKDAMDQIAAFLIEKETITGKEFMQIFRKVKGIPEPEEKAEDKAGDKPEDEDTGREYRAQEQASVGGNGAGQDPVEGSQDTAGQDTGNFPADGPSADHTPGDSTSGRYPASDDTQENRWNHPGDGYRS